MGGPEKGGTLCTVTQLARDRMSSGLSSLVWLPHSWGSLGDGGYFFPRPRDLAPKDRNGASDPFVRVRYNGRTQETSVRRPVGWGVGMEAEGPIRAPHCLTTSSLSPGRAGWECHLIEEAEKSGVTSLESASQVPALLEPTPAG